MKLEELPVVMAPVHSSLFVLPNFSDVFPLLPTDLDHILQRKVNVNDVNYLTVSWIITFLAQSVNHLY